MTRKKRYRAAHAAKRAESLEQGTKRQSAHGGCLGIRRRRRTRQAAKIQDEVQMAIDSWVSEWENPRASVSLC